MTKRLIALLLCIATMLSLMGSGVPTAVGEAAVSEAVTAVAAAEETAACAYCDAVTAEDGTVTHADGCNAAYVYDGTADVGKYAQIIAGEYGISVCDGEDISESGSILFYGEDFSEGTVFTITDWYWDSVTTALWYRVAFYSGGVVGDYAADWPADPWVLQDYTDTTYEYDPALEFVTVEQPETPCDICGETGCTKTHVYCDICGKYDCGLSHIYCPVCGTVDCTVQHSYCGICGTYDCGIEHEDIYAPITAPELPDGYVLPEGCDHAVVDKNGVEITADGFVVPEGGKASLSAWTKFDHDTNITDVSYKWQIRYNASGDLWTDIGGQTGKGILVSPAMFLSMIEYAGTTAIRSVVTANGETLTGEAIPVTIGSTTAISASTAPMAVDMADEELQEYYVVVQYVYSDGRTAAATDFAEIIPGNAYTHSYTLPVIPGYKATLNTHSYGDSVSLTDTTLELNFAENTLTEDYTIFTVTYVPDYVTYTVIHYWQNVDNDNYTEHERETVSTEHKTGDVITDAHKTYPGFFHLLYETPAAAADGSTVIEVYYDRYYYLMTFALGDMAYGVDPIYARYGDTVEIGTPTRAGYTFLGWQLNGGSDIISPADMPTTMPAENRSYTAVWKMNDTAKVSVVFWGENPNDDNYSYLTTGVVEVAPGTQYTFADGQTVFLICGKDEHTHGAECNLICGKTEHTQHSDTCLNCDHICGLDCYSADGNELVETTKPSQITIGNPISGTVYSYRGDYGMTRYYLYLNGKWYRADGSFWNGGGDTQEIEYTCTHLHDANCYGCEYHEHVAAFYSCGMEEHTHDSTCNQNGSGLDSSLWTFVRSETVTVAADGSSVVNVYYDRVEYSVGFYSNQNCTNEFTELRITAKWGANILNQWPTYNGSASWLVEGKSNTWQNSIQIMPVGGAKFWGPKTGSSSYKAYYYVEALPGDTDTFVYNGITYKLHHTDVSSSSGNVTDEERYAIEGFSYKEGTANGTSYSNAKFYYTRHKYAIEFYNPTAMIRKTENVPYEASLSGYNWTPDASQAPNIYEPGSVAFEGWYLNPECTGEKFDFSSRTMPSGTNDGDTTLTLYAKWEPVSYKVNYYLTKDSLDRGEIIPVEMERLVREAVAAGATQPAADPYTTVYAEKSVQHGGYIGEIGDPKVSEGYEKIHPRAGYDFIGWFYLNDAGEETAFDPENMPVHQDLNLYGKWSSNVLCYYNVYFALDANADGIADEVDGSIVYVADPISGSAIAGRTYTFTAKGGDDLYDPDGDANYQEGYFPTVGSHSIVIDIQDEAGTSTNRYTFLYRPKTAVPYTVRYVDKDTGAALFEEKVVSDNKNVVVTENFLYKQGYMPDAYQKTLVVTDDDDDSNDVITFYYTKDETHALYVVNYYIQELDENLNHAGWTKYTDLQYTGDIGTEYSADAITIDGFSLSASYTDDYNTKLVNGMTGAALPTTVSALTEGKLTGTLAAEGMELNFYYTRNLYPYEFRYMLNGTSTELADPEYGKAGYDTIVTKGAKEIEMDLDGDGINEDYRLFDPTETTKDIHIIKDGEPLGADANVVKGQATVNVATFYYVRCTQTMTITKTVVDNSADKSADLNHEFTLSLLIHAKNGYHQTSYSYTKTDDTSGTLSPEVTAPNTLQFSLKAGQSITIEGLPTAEYTLTELDLPVGYYDTYNTTQENGRYKLTVDGQVDAVVTNSYEPANLSITKIVDVVEEGNNTPEVTEFKFTIRFPDEVAVESTYDYFVSYLNQEDDTSTIVNKTADVMEGTETVEDENVEFKYVEITLKNGEVAAFENLPIGTYVVTEAAYEAYGYNDLYSVNGAEAKDLDSVEVTLSRGNTTNVECKNKFPVGDLMIEKTVTKEFFKDSWDGDTFTFTVDRWNEVDGSNTETALVNGNTYSLYLDGSTQPTGSATVVNNQLVVEIKFTGSADDTEDPEFKTDAEKLMVDGETVTHKLLIKNLPVGIYRVIETADEAYNQKPTGLMVSGIQVPKPVDTETGNSTATAAAQFTNQLKRYYGTLEITKAVELIGDVENPDPNKTKLFDITVKLTEDPNFNGTVNVAYSPTVEGDTRPATVQVVDGSFTIQLREDETAFITQVPAVGFTVEEANYEDYDDVITLLSGSLTVNGVWTIDKTTPAKVLVTNNYPVKVGTLTIVKTISGNVPEGEKQSFLFHIKGTDNDVDMDVVINGAGQITISEMPLGTYTVTEDTAWSWRYHCAEPAKTAEITADAVNKTVTFENAYTDSKWLTELVTVVNKFTQTSQSTPAE